MKTLNDHKKVIDDTKEYLKSEKIETIDFDSLIDSLESSSNLVDNFARHQSEYNLLRDDYTGRIAGMAKAIAVASSRKSEMRDLLDFVNSLEALTAEQLLGAYRKIQAKFQDCFPASFGLLKNRNNQAMEKSISEFK